jgi:hypothetical protein
VIDNDVRTRGAADLGLVTGIENAKDAGNNCFSGNKLETSLPEHLPAFVPCGKPASPAFQTDLGKFASLLTAKKPPAADYRTVVLPPPPDLPDMPDAATAPPQPANTGVPIAIDVTDITLPSMPTNP